MVMYLEDVEDSVGERKPIRRNVPAVSTTIRMISADDETEVAELRAANRLMVAGLNQALELRGIFLAMRDPLLLQDEKNALIERAKQIEANIRLAIEKSDR